MPGYEKPVPSLADALANPSLILSPDDGWRLFTEFGLKHDERYDADVPALITRRRHFTGQIENGSYLIIGQRDDSQTMEDVVPVLGDIPLLGRLFRVVQQQKIIHLAALQVIVSETSD